MVNSKVIFLVHEKDFIFEAEVMKVVNIPFYSNTPDDTHCFQAALKMVLKYFLPAEEFSFERLDEISAKKEGLWTWPLAAALWMQDREFEVVNIEPFDYPRFIEEGGAYLIEEYGQEVGEAQIKHSDIDQERAFSKRFIQRVKIQKRIPAIDDIRELMEQGFVVIANINSQALDSEEGYTGHFVVITGIDHRSIVLNDPGLPGRESYGVSLKNFEKAWAYPDEKAKNILAFKLERSSASHK